MNALRNLKVGVRLSLGFGALAAGLVIVAVTSLLAMGALRDDSRELAHATCRPPATSARSRRSLTAAIAKLGQAQTARSEASAASGRRTIIVVALLALLALLALAAAAALCAWITRSITRPVPEVGNRLESLNEHCVSDLTAGLGVATVEQTREAFERIGAAVADINDRIGDIAGAAAGSRPRPSACRPTSPRSPRWPSRPRPPRSRCRPRRSRPARRRSRSRRARPTWPAPPRTSSTPSAGFKVAG